MAWRGDTRYSAAFSSGLGLAGRRLHVGPRDLGARDSQWPSLLAVLGFFAGGLLMTHVLLPLLLQARMGHAASTIIEVLETLPAWTIVSATAAVASVYFVAAAPRSASSS